jgi:hypothetical protein
MISNTACSGVLTWIMTVPVGQIKFSSLPQSLKKATGNIIKQFKTSLKHYLLTHSFYSIDEYFNAKKTVTSINSKLQCILKHSTGSFCLFADCAVCIQLAW